MHESEQATKGCVALAYEVEGKITRVANVPTALELVQF